MIQTITKDDFRNAFFHMNRNENFSYEGLGALYDFLEECDPNHELCVITLCCEFYEDSIENTLKEYDLESLEELEENTIVVWHDDKSVLYRAY